MKRLEAQVEIDAPTDVVWEVVKDFGAYPEWNPFLVELSGEMVVGERLRARIQPPGKRATTFKPMVTAVDEGEYFEWLGRVGIPGVFDGRHQFRIEAHGEKTRFTQSEEFSGILLRFMRKLIDGPTRQAVEAANVALKQRAEAKARQGT